MVSIDSDNVYALRNHLLKQAKELSKSDAYKHALLSHLGYLPIDTSIQTTQSYKKCAILGFAEHILPEDKQALTVLLGQAHHIDGTPSPWVSDIWGALGVKFAVEKTNDSEISKKFSDWSKDFIPQRIKDGRLAPHERAIADYIMGNAFTPTSAASIALFLHFQGVQTINDVSTKENYIKQFLDEFKNAYTQNLPAPILSVLVYVFDRLNKEVALAPPNNWSLIDLINFLDNIPVGLRRWTWEDQAKTVRGNAVKWAIENEYHVQNLLYLLLAPIFKDVTDENYSASVGQKNPRIDLYLPSSHTIIEVKYKKDNKKSFQSLIGEVSEDAGLYKADPRFKNCKLIVFLWDHTKATQEHAKFKEGVLKIPGIDGCVVISSPSVMA